MIRLCLAEMAQDRGIKRAELARRSGLSYVVVSRYWNNEIRHISLEVLEALGAALGISGTNLLTDLPLPAALRKRKRRLRFKKKDLLTDTPLPEVTQTSEKALYSMIEGLEISKQNYSTNL